MTSPDAAIIGPDEPARSEAIDLLESGPLPVASFSAEPSPTAGTDPTSLSVSGPASELRGPVHGATIKTVETRWTVTECRAGYERLLMLLFRPGRREDAAGGMGPREETDVA